VIVLLGKISGRHYNYREIRPGVTALKSSAPRMWLHEKQADPETQPYHPNPLWKAADSLNLKT
jgi:hypothetical protein